MAGLEYRGSTETVVSAIVNAINLAYRRRETVADVPALRAVASKGAGNTTSLAPRAIRYVTSATRCFVWNDESTATDNGTSVVKPSDRTTGQAGRWRLQDEGTLALADGTLISEATTGYIKNVIYYDGQRAIDEFEAQIYGQRPCVVVDFLGRGKERKSGQPGALAWATYRFEIDCISFCARPEERGFRGAGVTAEEALDPGAWAMAEDVEHLLDGATGEQLGVSGIAWCSVGDMEIVERDASLNGRKAVVSLGLEVYATIGRKDADALALTALNAQPQIGIARPGDEDVDPDNVIVSGLTVARTSMNLSAAPADGSAVIDGATVSVTGATAHSFTASRDTYRDLDTDGVFTYTAVQIEAAAPAQAAGTLRVGKTRTDAASIVQDTLLAPTLRDFGDAFQIAP